MNVEYISSKEKGITLELFSAPEPFELWGALCVKLDPKEFLHMGEAGDLIPVLILSSLKIIWVKRDDRVRVVDYNLNWQYKEGSL